MQYQSGTPSLAPPTAYGWIVTLECNLPGIARCPGGGSFAFCATNRLTTQACWATPYPANATGIVEKKFKGITGLGSVQFDVARQLAYVGGGFDRRPYPALIYPGFRPVGGVVGSVPVQRTRALTETGYNPTAEGFTGWSGSRFWSRPHWRMDIFIRVIVDPVGTRPLPVPVTVPRAVPIALTKELKINTHTAAGRTFATMLMAWNFMGDTWGFVGALWRALPREARGRSRRLGAMLNDLYRGWFYFNPYLEKNQRHLLNAMRNVALWKFSDTVMGGAQSSLFEAQTAVAGAMFARVWASLDSHGRAQAQSLARTFSERGREQNSHRGG